jgi:integrase
MIPNLFYHCLEKNGKGYIRLRFSYKGKKIDLYPSTKITVNPKDWDKDNEKNHIKKSDLSHREKNTILNDFKNSIENVLRILHLRGIAFTKENIEYLILTQQSSNPSIKIDYPLVDILNKWNDNIEKSKLKSKSYQKTVKSVCNFLIDFFSTKEGSKYNRFEDINRTFFDEYTNYCIDTLKYSNDTIKKHIYTFKTFLRWALDNKYHSSAITNYVPKMAVAKHDIIYLTEEEVLALWNFNEFEYEIYDGENYKENPKHKKYTTEYVINNRDTIKGTMGGSSTKLLTNWELVRDMFIFACVSGLRYSDVVNLKCDCIEDNNTYISIIPQKTQKSGIRVNIPMGTEKDNIMRRIFWKYVSGKSENQYVFPRTKFDNPYPNQKINVILKDITKIKKIEKQLSRKVSVQLISGDKVKKGTEEKKSISEVLSFHAARRTYATRAMKIIGDADQIMKVTGHLSKRVFSRYVGVNKNSLDKMQKLWNENSLKDFSDEDFEKLTKDEKIQYLLDKKVNREISEEQFNLKVSLLIK